MLILDLASVDKSDIDTVGGKAANLGELMQQGFPVPPGFVVTAQAYAGLIDHFGLPASDEIVNDAAALCSTVRYKIAATSMPQEIDEQLRHFHESLQRSRDRDVIYAVRSSATAEDLSDASFAGQHDTYYYVEYKNLAMMVKKCWASLWSEGAYSYRQTQGISHREVNMAVIVQEMIRSDSSGVTFTADPVSGSDQLIVTESSWGMGAAIVDGRVTPDQYVVNKADGRLVSTRISDKKFMVPSSLQKRETSRLTEVPVHLQRAESLDSKQLATITLWSKKSEAYFGCQQDIEWAFENGEFFILQSRPITVVGQQAENLPDGKFVLFKPLAENFTDPLLPLSQDLLIRVFPILTIIYGRAYMRLSHVRSIIPLKMSDEDLSSLAYLGDVSDIKTRISILRLTGLTLLLSGVYLVFGVLSKRCENMPDDFMQSFRGYVQKIVDNKRISAPEAMAALFLKTGFFEPVGNMVLLVNLVAPRYIALLAILNALLKRWLPGLQDDAGSRLSSGNEGVLSTDMGRSIWQLAKIVREDPHLSTIVQQESSGTALAKLRDDSRAEKFNDALTAFLNMHGHRTLKEFELNSVRWEEDPSPVIAMVRNYLLAESDPDTFEARVAEQRTALEEEVQTGLGHFFLEPSLGLRWRMISFIRTKAKYFIKLRENSRFYHIMGFYAVRQKILSVEKELMEAGILKCKDDIFYLHWHEIEDLRKGPLAWEDVEDLIRARRMRHIRLTKMRPPKTVGIDLAPVIKQHENADQLKGQAASPGSYQGIARVIMDPATDAEIRPGEILIAPYTDPAWTPLFLTAHGAVIEVGSYLSHAGTIAREYGMPCVVDVTDCTSRISTGDMVHVDGSSGVVTIIRSISTETPEPGEAK